MKSQFFQEIQINYVPRRPIQGTEPYKRVNHGYSIKNNKKSLVKNMKSQNRELHFSVNNMQRAKQQTQNREVRMTYNKPMQYIESITQILPLSYQKDLSIVYDQLKTQKQRQVKVIKMQNEQFLTQQKQRYIKMEKKFLLKEKQYIELYSEYSLLLRQIQVLKEQKKYIWEQFNIQKENLDNYQVEINILKENARIKSQKNENFHYFLRLLLEQTQTVINWAKIFQLSSDDLPPMINMIKKDIEQRKFDLQVTLKQAANFEKLNFSIIESKNDSKNNTFLDEDQIYSESFMKYLKQQSARSKPHSLKKSPAALDQSRLLQLQNNKENMDLNNRNSINFIINSKEYDIKGKSKNQNFSDQYLRILLLQAKTIEKNYQWRNLSIKTVKNPYQFQGIKCCESQNISIAIQ